MAHETTPLLSEVENERIPNGGIPGDSEVQRDSTQEVDQSVYERFSAAQKRAILLLVAYIGLINLLVVGSFYPEIPDIAKDLHTTEEAVSLAVGVTVLSTSITALIGAAFSGFYGQRAVFVWAVPLLIVGSLGMTLAATVGQLIIWRFIQVSGASFAYSVGPAVIGDIYGLEERGTGIGIFLAVCLIGRASAPVVGGFATQYASWRAMQAVLGVAGLIGWVLIYLCLPETSLPGTRGIDKRRRTLESGRDVPYVFPNPFKVLLLLRNPVLLCVSFVGLAVLLTDYVIVLPLPYVLAPRYGITDQSKIGLLYVPMAAGNFIGAPTAGWLSDTVVMKMRRRRGGVWCPEDRLRTVLLGTGIFVPLSVLGVGVFTEYVPGRVGLVLNMICLFLNGFGMDLVMGPTSAYIVDIMQAKSAESIAAINAFRFLLISIIVTGVNPAINHLGIFWTNAMAALVAWIGLGVLYYTIRHGNRMRSSTHIR